LSTHVEGNTRIPSENWLEIPEGVSSLTVSCGVEVVRVTYQWMIATLTTTTTTTTREGGLGVVRER